MTDKLSDVLDVVVFESEKSSLPAKSVKSLEDNYEFSQKTLKTLVNTSMSIIDDFKDVVSETNEPKAIQALSSIMKATADMTTKILEADRLKIAIEMEGRQINKPGQPTNQQINNNTTQQNTTIYVGSTADLLNMFNELPKDTVTVELKDDRQQQPDA